MKNKFCGYVIDSVDYKDNDSIVTILCEDGLVSLKARGAKKITSKMNSVLFNYAYSEFEVNKSEKSGYLTLLDGTLLNYPNFVINSLDYLTIMGIVSEGINKCKDNENLYTAFKDCLSLMENGVNCKVLIVAFLNFMLESEGAKYEGDKCVSCLDKKVSSFSFEMGGFLCNKCSHISEDVSYLKTMRILTKINLKNALKITETNANYDIYIGHAFESLENKCGIYFKGKDFLLKVLKMEG